MVGFNVRKVIISDYNDICRLNEEEKYSFNNESIYNNILNIIEDKNHIMLVAQLNDDVIGYIHGIACEIFNSVTGMIGFVVDDRYRNLGIGKQLISDLESCAKENKYCGISLDKDYYSTKSQKYCEKYGYINKNQVNDIVKYI